MGPKKGYVAAAAEYKLTAVVQLKPPKSDRAYVQLGPGIDLTIGKSPQTYRRAWGSHSENDPIN